MRFLWYLALWLAVAAPASLTAQNPAGVEQTANGYKVDFNDQDIQVVLSALAEAAGLNVTFSNLPPIRTTLHLGQPVPKDQLLNVMQGVAEQNGLAMIVDGSLVRIARTRRREQGLAGEREERPKVELYTYRLKHASVAQIAPLLMNLFTGTSLGAGNGGPPAGGGNANRNDNGISSVINGILNNATTGNNNQPLSVLVSPSPSQPQGGGDDNGGAAQGGGAGGGPGGRQGKRRAAETLSQVRIVGEEATNTLLIRATAGEWELIQKLVQEIDLRPLQVLIEAVIVEVARTKQLNVGVDATVTHAHDRQTANARLPQTPDARDFIVALADRWGTVDFKAALNALATRGDLRVRSLPVIIAQNNKQALLNVGSSRPFVSVSQSSGLATGVIQTIQYIDVGTKLQITPRINADGYVNLEVAQTANSATNEIQFDAPVLNRREATTQVFLRDGQTTVLGGLADHTRDRSRSGIPVLRSLPVIGGLFGSTHESEVETELYVFLTPHIISEDADIDRLRDSLQQHSKELRQEPVQPVFPSKPETPAP